MSKYDSGLDFIIDQGFKRIDEAIERVIQRVSPDSPIIHTVIIRTCKLCGRENPHRHQSFCVNLNCSGPITERVEHYTDHPLIQSGSIK